MFLEPVQGKDRFRDVIEGAARTHVDRMRESHWARRAGYPSFTLSSFDFVIAAVHVVRRSSFGKISSSRTSAQYSVQSTVHLAETATAHTGSHLGTLETAPTQTSSGRRKCTRGKALQRSMAEDQRQHGRLQHHRVNTKIRSPSAIPRTSSTRCRHRCTAQLNNAPPSVLATLHREDRQEHRTQHRVTECPPHNRLREQAYYHVEELSENQRRQQRELQRHKENVHDEDDGGVERKHCIIHTGSG